MELGVANLTDIDPVTVEAVLTYHVISGNVTSDNIPTGAVTTLGGDMMIDASKLTITDLNGRVSNITPKTTSIIYLELSF